MQLEIDNSLEGTETSNSRRKTKEVALALAAATGALLGVPAFAEGEPGSWDVDAAVLYYGEDNSRVQATEPAISATRYFNNNKSLNLKLVLDTLTGASPSGATPSDEIQTFTRPSGNGGYSIAAGEQPLDDTFRDTRTALSASWGAEINRDWTYSTAIYGSSEHDYTSLGLSGIVSRYFNLKNTQLNLGLSYSSDSVSPVGGQPVGLSRFALADMSDFDSQYEASRAGDSDTKSILDVTVGFSQVINKRTIMQFNYALSQASGYLTDPYKILSVIDDQPGTRYGANFLDSTGLAVYIYEQRPDSRTKNALYWQIKHMLDGGDVIDASYRFMSDDWGIQSHTVDVKYRWQFSRSHLEPHVRYYTQGAADFYRRFINSTDYEGGLANINDASADYRLGDMDTVTVGAKYARELADEREFYLRAEYYIQTPSGDDGFGALTDQDLYLDTKAMMFTLGYSF